MTQTELDEIRQRYAQPLDIRYTTAAVQSLWQQAQQDIAALLQEIAELRDEYFNLAMELIEEKE
jgi:hypothetical protein